MPASNLKQKEAFKRIFDSLTMHEVNIDEMGDKTIREFIPSQYELSEFNEILYTKIKEVCRTEYGWLVQDIEPNNLVNDQTTFNKLFAALFDPNNGYIIITQ